MPDQKVLRKTIEMNFKDFFWTLNKEINQQPRRFQSNGLRKGPL